MGVGQLNCWRVRVESWSTQLLDWPNPIVGQLFVGQLLGSSCFPFSLSYLFSLFPFSCLFPFSLSFSPFWRGLGGVWWEFGGGGLGGLGVWAFGVLLSFSGGLGSGGGLGV